MKKSVQKTVFCFIVVDKHILLLSRKNTWFENGMFCPPGGNVDANESPADAAVREVFEETNLEISKRNLTCIKNYQSSTKDRVFDNYYFVCTSYSGKLENKEPDRHDKLEWFSLHSLPKNTSTLVTKSLHLI